jgi:tetratricopeptide (TPR) repeat protein
MKNLLVLLLISITSALPAIAQDAPAAVAQLSPAQRSIAESMSVILEKPNQYTSYNLLAAAFLRRARETDDPSFYAQADDAVNKSLQLSPNNFETEKLRVAILLGRHDYTAALEAAKVLNKKIPDDVMVYGLLADAETELGKYKDAEKDTQWMLNLRPGNLPALVHAARLRELFGDLEGSYELFELAYESTPPTETEERAWLLTQLGHLRFTSGNVDAADKLLQQALAAFPNYGQALGVLGEVRIAQKQYEDAVDLLRRRCQAAPHAAYFYDLAQALSLAGKDGEAKSAFAQFETKALLESSSKDNSNRELIFYYADYAKQPAKALKLAEQEYAWRKDIYTLDAYAWALHLNGQDAEALKQIEIALAVGVREAKISRHAKEILDSK